MLTLVTCIFSQSENDRKIDVRRKNKFEKFKLRKSNGNISVEFFIFDSSFRFDHQRNEPLFDRNRFIFIGNFIRRYVFEPTTMFENEWRVFQQNHVIKPFVGRFIDFFSEIFENWKRKGLSRFFVIVKSFRTHKHPARQIQE